MILVARNKTYTAIGLIVLYIAINLAAWLVPGEYGLYLKAAWWVWLAGLVWLGWSFIVPLLMVKKVKLDPALAQAFSGVDAAVVKISTDRQELESAIQVAEVQMAALMKLVAGFIERANRLKQEQEWLQSGDMGRIGFYDPNFKLMLVTLPEDKRRESIEDEMGTLAAFEDALREQAEVLRKKVMMSRQLIIQQQHKLIGSRAEVPLLRMESELGSCLTLLPQYAPRGSRMGFIFSTDTLKQLAAGDRRV